MIAVLVIVTLGFSASVLVLVRDGWRLRRTIERLERRIATLELDGAPTLVIEPEKSDPPPRRPSQLLN
ncbi:MAG: hypothetical protein JWM53_6779 [bacterium]|nr:hypothetical protein [bacterium]